MVVVVERKVEEKRKHFLVEQSLQKECVTSIVVVVPWMDTLGTTKKGRCGAGHYA